MKEPLLLDTSVLYWIVTSSSRLSQPARRAIERGSLVVSVASYWEITIKSGRGGLIIPNPLPWWEKAIDQTGAHVLPIWINHVTALQTLPDYHRDPFDRIIAAQAISEGYALVTSDAILQKYPVRFIW